MTGGALLPVLRGLHLGAVLSLFGVLVFGLAILPAAPGGPPDGRPALERRLSRLARISAGLALLLGAAWFVAETAAIAGVSRIGAVVGFIPVVALHTQFGFWLSLRLGLLLIVLPLPAHRALRWPAVLLSAAAVIAQPMLAHAGAEPGRTGTLLVAGEAIHLVAAGAWLGGLLSLWLSVRCLPPAIAARLCMRFSWLGIAAVGLVALTGLLLGFALVGSAAALVDTGYGRFVLLKTGLFLLALVLAGLNRFVFTADLARGERHRLLASVAVEAGIGLAIVLAAALLATQMPGADRQPQAVQDRATMRHTGLWQPASPGLGIAGSDMPPIALWRQAGRHWMASPLGAIGRIVVVERRGRHEHRR